MRVLLDENLPLEFAAAFPGFEVTTVQSLGWSGIQNGELMRRAAAVCDVFVTMDRNLPHQQYISASTRSRAGALAETSRVDDTA